MSSSPVPVPRNIISTIQIVKDKKGKTYDRSPARDIYLQEVLPLVPRERCGEESRTLVHIAVATERLCVRVQHDLVRALLLDTNAVVGEAVLRVEVEDPQETGTLEHDDLVALVLQADVCLWCVQPAILLLGPLHLAVELVEEPVAQEFVIDEVELATSIVEAVVVALAREVEPLWVTKLVALEVQVSLASQSMRDQSDQLVQR